MKEHIIQMQGLTKNYGKGRGIFDIDLNLAPGEVYGYIGTNGSGKTTTIRSLMGFIHPDAGSVTIKGMDAWKCSTELKKWMSYIPGEIEFPRFATGTAFLNYQAQYLNITDFTYMNKLIHLLQLDTSANLRRMSKGMKQKTAIVAALMGDREILILDEPTTGLDPLMRDVFLDLIQNEKQKGKTIFMSSHIFEEIEEVCDKAAMIFDGKIVDYVDVTKLRHQPVKTFHISFVSAKDFHTFLASWEAAVLTDEKNSECTVILPPAQLPELLQELSKYRIRKLREQRMTLEDRFKKIYEKGSNPK